MNRQRSNAEWLDALSQAGSTQERALDDLRDYLLRAVLLYLRDHRSDLSEFSIADIRELAEDIAQDSLIAIRKKLGTFRGDAKFTTWAYRFALNRAISELRHRRYRDTSWEKITSGVRGTGSAAVLFQQNPEPAALAELKGIMADMRQIILTELTERQQWATIAVYFNGRSMAETAAELEMSPNALYKLLYDARAKIKLRLLEIYEDKNEILRLL